MTEKELRNKVVNVATSYLGIAEGSAGHKEILSLYNNYSDPHRRSYTMQLSDAWCMTFVSACFIKAGLADLIVTECGCGEAVERNRTYKTNWVESDSYKPSAGDIIMYDWDDSGSADNTGWPDHTGIVESCDGSTIKIIEGNYSDTVKRRSLAVNGRYIRGFITPDFASKATAETPVSSNDGELSDEAMFAYFKGQGFTDAGAAALMGNFYAESALKSTNLQNTYEKSLGMTDEQYTTAVDNGSYTNFVRDSAGYGLAQWTYWSRKQALLEYARSKGTSIGNRKMQCEFTVKELKEDFSSVLAVLKSAATVKAASDVLLTKFEQPADQSDTVKEKRASFGQKYYDLYAGKKAEAPVAEKESYGDAITISLNALKNGSRGPLVKTVQRILRAAGINADIAIDGSFGPITEAAVILLQKKLFPDKKDEWDGVVGPKTWTAMLTKLN